MASYSHLEPTSQTSTPRTYTLLRRSRKVDVNLSAKCYRQPLPTYPSSSSSLAGCWLPVPKRHRRKLCLCWKFLQLGHLQVMFWCIDDPVQEWSPQIRVPACCFLELTNGSWIQYSSSQLRFAGNIYPDVSLIIYSTGRPSNVSKLKGYTVFLCLKLFLLPPKLQVMCQTFHGSYPFNTLLGLFRKCF